jgi:TPP-dependent pyruvate/acetoin dehydrogenase alpha subunit
LFLRGLIPGTIHLSLGQEATVAGACLALSPDDLITLTHRGHGQALAKGVSAASLMAEILGKETGCCRGMGGSLHVGDITVGALPAIAIVGASSPIATGMAFAAQRRGENTVVGNFFGDGTVNKGDWHEAMNLAALWSLPVIFICENNLWAISTHISEAIPNDDTAERAAAYRMPASTIDGNDPIEVYEAVSKAAARARRGDGPTYVECITYRRGGHKRDDPATYRPREEVDEWLAHDPIPLFRERLLADDRFGEGTVTAVDDEIAAELDAAVEFAKTSALPSEEQLP